MAPPPPYVAPPPPYYAPYVAPPPAPYIYVYVAPPPPPPTPSPTIATTSVSTTSSASVASGAKVVSINNVLGVKTGDSFTIADGTNSETATIVGVNAGRKRRATSGTVELANPLQYSYAAGSTVTVLVRKNCEELGYTKIVNGICGESDLGLASGCTDGPLAAAKEVCSAAGARLCTVDEIDSGVTAGTGCNADIKYTWTSTWCGLGPEGGKYYVGMGGGGVPSDRKCKNPKKSYAVRCCSDVDLAATTALPVTTTTTFPFLSTRKDCAALGWEVTGVACGESDKAFKKGLDKCFTNKNHPDAERKCLKLGGRMCSQADIERGVGMTTGCNFDSQLLWTSTPCGTNSFIRAKGNGDQSKECAAAKSKGPMRCCSDVNLSGNYVVTAAGGKFYVDGIMNPPLHLTKGQTYTFDVSSTTMAAHPFRLSTTTDGTHGGGAEYASAVTYSGTQGQTAASVTITMSEATAASLHYYCAVHPSMGNSFSIGNQQPGAPV